VRRDRLLTRIIAGMRDSGLAPDLVEPILEEAEEGNAPAQFIVASALERAAELGEAKDWYQRAARQGYHPAQERLRRLHLSAA